MNHFINKNYSSPEKLNKSYLMNKPFPHIVLDNFINSELLNDIMNEFPDLSKIQSGVKHENSREIKFSSKGFSDISPKAFELIAYLNSDIFVTYLQKLTGIKEVLISDPYLSGGGYHEIKNGGVLKVHADFNKHPFLDLDRRINVLIYLNPQWKKEWGGSLELYHENDLNSPYVSVTPEFNRCVIFSTTSSTYHGNPEPVNCPKGMSRKSIALYYFSLGRPKSEINSPHSTLFVETKGERFESRLTFRKLAIDLIPPLLLKYLKKILRR